MKEKTQVAEDMTADGEKLDIDFLRIIRFVLDAKQKEKLLRQLLLIILFPIEEMNIYSGIMIIGSLFARNAMIGRL